MREFELQVNEAFKKCPDMDEQDKQDLKFKYMEQFGQNIKYGIKKTFGVCGTPGAAADLPLEDDVTVDDIESMQYAMANATSRRARYPKAMSEKLEKTLEANYKTLQVLKADIPEIEIGNPTGSTNLDLQRNSLQAASNTIKACQKKLTDSLEKPDRLITAFNIIKSNQNSVE